MSNPVFQPVESWEWTPGRSVGPFLFGAEVLLIGAEFGFEPCTFCSSKGNLSFYACPNSRARVFHAEGRITGVCCQFSLRYEGQELLERDREYVRRILGREDDAASVSAADYATLGLTLWFEEGRTTSGTCGPAGDSMTLDV